MLSMLKVWGGGATKNVHPLTGEDEMFHNVSREGGGGCSMF